MSSNIILTLITGGFFGAVVTMAGWFVTDYQRRKDAEINRLIDFIQKQIFELYAPLRILTAKELGYRKLRDDITSKVSEDRRSQLRQQFTSDYVIPAQKEIYDLLQNKWYLVRNGQKPIPQSFDTVLEHCSTAHVLHELYIKGMGNFDEVKAHPMPAEFNEDVELILEGLRAEHSKLMRVKT